MKTPKDVRRMLAEKVAAAIGTTVEASDRNAVHRVTTADEFVMPGSIAAKAKGCICPEKQPEIEVTPDELTGSGMTRAVAAIIHRKCPVHAGCGIQVPEEYATLDGHRCACGLQPGHAKAGNPVHKCFAPGCHGEWSYVECNECSVPHMRFEAVTLPDGRAADDVEDMTTMDAFDKFLDLLYNATEDPAEARARAKPIEDRMRAKLDRVVATGGEVAGQLAMVAFVAGVRRMLFDAHAEIPDPAADAETIASAIEAAEAIRASDTPGTPGKGSPVVH